MSKFLKPKIATAAAPTEAAIARVIGAAETHDVSAASAADEIRFTMTLPLDLAGDVDAARQRARLTRLGWIRIAITEKLQREGR